MSTVNIARMMEKREVGVSELARRLDVQRQTIYFYIKQGDKNPIYQLQKIADALGVGLSELISDNDKVKDHNSITCPKCGQRFVMENNK